MGDFELELSIDELDARLGELVRGHVRAQWEAARSGRAAPPWPVALAEPGWVERCARARAARDALLQRRATLLWRHAARARVHADANVSAAAGVAERDPSALLALVDERNRVARSLGFEHFGALAVALDGSAEPPAAVAAPAAAPAASAPAQPNAALAWLAKRGIDARPATWVIAPGAAPRTFTVDAPGDVRVLAEPPRTSAGWLALLHEAGHAWLAGSHAAELPWALRDAPARIGHEAVAEWVAGAAASEAFALDVLGLGPDAARAWRAGRLAARETARARRRVRAADEWRLYRERCAPAGEGTWSTGARRQLATDPGAQLLYAAVEPLVDALTARFGDPIEGGAPRLRNELGRPGASRAWAFAV